MTASNQLNIVWLNRLMHQELFADLVVRLVPKHSIPQVRYWVQTRRQPEAKTATAQGDESDRVLAEERLEGD